MGRRTGTIEELVRKTSEKNKDWYAYQCKCNGFSVSVPSFVWEKLPAELKVGDTCQFEVQENKQGYLDAIKVEVVGNYEPELAEARNALIEKRMHETQDRIDEAILQKKALKIAEVSACTGKTVTEIIALYSEAKKLMSEKVE